MPFNSRTTYILSYVRREISNLKPDDTRMIDHPTHLNNHMTTPEKYNFTKENTLLITTLLPSQFTNSVKHNNLTRYVAQSEAVTTNKACLVCVLFRKGPRGEVKPKDRGLCARRDDVRGHET
jgi:hypothetical protein